MALRAVGGGGSAIGVSPQNNGISNFTVQNTQKLRMGAARIRSGPFVGSTFKIACIGDSVMNGYDAVSTNSLYPGARPLAIPQLLANVLLNGSRLPAQSDSWFGNPPTGTAAALMAYDTRLNIINFTTTGFNGPGGAALDSVVNGASIAFTPASAFDTIDIFYAQQATGGSFTVNVDGGATLATINTTGALAYIKQTITGVARGTHTINLTTTSTTDTQINGMAVRDSTIPRAEIYQLSINGVTAGSYNGVFSGRGPTLGIPVVAPDVSFINLTINDINLVNETVAAYTTNLQSIITACAASGDVILCIGNPGSEANQTNGVGLGYINAVYALAAPGGPNGVNGLPVLDFVVRMVSFAVANALSPYYDTNVPSLHPGRIWYADHAAAMSQFFQ
jgi:lysophospholipase L1-like esterase